MCNPNSATNTTKDLDEDADQSFKIATDHSYSKETKKKTERRNRAVTKRIKFNSKISNSLIEFRKRSDHCLDQHEKFNLKLLLSLTNSPDHMATSILAQAKLKEKILDKVCASLGERPRHMRSRIEGTSVLMAKSPSDLENLHVSDIIEEFKEKFPELLQMIMSVMVPPEKLQNEEHLAQIVPRIALIYSVMLQSRCNDLSRFQRVLSICMADSISDQAVYDRLNRLGIVIPYSNTVTLISQLGQQYTTILAQALKDDQYLRLIGDNLNFSIGPKQETAVKHQHMEHWFASTALISKKLFQDIPNQPQIPLDQLTLQNLLLSEDEYQHIRKDTVKLIVDIISKHLPQLHFTKASVPVSLKSKAPSHKTLVVPLPLLPYNEQKYQDDIKILDWYENLLCQALDQSGIADAQTRKFQIGGDQLTRERLSDAMLLRFENQDPKDRFAHIGRCVTEFFHLGMNYLQRAIFNVLWGNDGFHEVGTLKGECERVSRNSVEENVSKAYDAAKQFVLDYTNANIVAAALDFFGMSDTNSQPTKHTPPEFQCEQEQKEWVYTTFGQFIDEYVFPCWSGYDRTEGSQEDTSEFPQNLVLQLEDGSSISLPLDVQRHTTIRQKRADKVKDYHHNALESGFTFHYFLELLKSPDRDSILGILKMMMLQLRGQSVKAKYPREILRILIQQYSVMGHQEACQVMQASFVNLHGKPDTHVPADLVQEWNVRESKSHIKHMFSNKSVRNIQNKTSALPSIHAIAKNYDEQTGTLIRSKRHTIKDNERDISIMIEDLKILKPYNTVEDRAYTSFKSVPKSLVERVDGLLLETWFSRNKECFND